MSAVTWHDLSALDRWELERLLRFACLVLSVTRNSDERDELAQLVTTHRAMEQADPMPEYMKVP